MKHHLLQNYRPVALSTGYETLVPPPPIIYVIHISKSGVASICSICSDVSVLSPSIYAALWTFCSASHISGLYKFPVQL